MREFAAGGVATTSRRSSSERLRPAGPNRSRWREQRAGGASTRARGVPRRPRHAARRGVVLAKRTVTATTLAIHCARAFELARTPEPACLVIFGASGDLTARKLIPALYNLALQHLLPASFAVVGSARRAMSTPEFRTELHDAVAGVQPHPSDQRGGLGHVRALDPLRPDRGRQRLRRARPRSRAHRHADRRERQSPLLPGDAAGRVRADHPRDRRAPAARRERMVARRGGEAIRPRSEERDAADERHPGGLPRGRGLPHRSLPRQGDGAEHPRPALREQHLRADLDTSVRRSRADHRGRVDRDRGARRLLRQRWGDARHRAEPPPAAPRARRHGAARGIR